MPNRIVRDGILTSERVNSLSIHAELFYRRLLSVVDDFGRYTANPMLLRASCYPLKLDSVKEDSISKHLAECVGARLIVLYTVADKAYLELQGFRQQVRAKVSKYPAPDMHMHSTCAADANHVQANAHLDGDGDGDGDGDVNTPTVLGGDGSPPFGRQQPIVDAYNRILRTGRGNPCEMASTPTDKLKRRLKAAEKVAKAVCKQQGWPYDPATFWAGYFTVCDGDPWMRGDLPNPKNPQWRQNLAVLLDDKRLGTVIDQAIESMRGDDESV